MNEWYMTWDDFQMIKNFSCNSKVKNLYFVLSSGVNNRGMIYPSHIGIFRHY